MAIAPSDILIYLTGGAANTNPFLSLGGTVSTTQVSAVALNDLFPNITAAEAAAGSICYIAVEYLNNHPTLTLTTPTLWESSGTTSAQTAMAFAYDSVGTQTIVNINTAPTGVSFSTPTTAATGIALTSIAPGGRRRVWYRRTVTAGATGLSADTGISSLTGDTLP